MLAEFLPAAMAAMSADTLAFVNFACGSKAQCSCCCEASGDGEEEEEEAGAGGPCSDSDHGGGDRDGAPGQALRLPRGAAAPAGEEEEEEQAAVFDRPGPSGWHALGDEGKASGKAAPAAAMAEAAGLQAMGGSRASYLPTGERASVCSAACHHPSCRNWCMREASASQPARLAHAWHKTPPGMHALGTTASHAATRCICRPPRAEPQQGACGGGRRGGGGGSHAAEPADAHLPLGSHGAGVWPVDCAVPPQGMPGVLQGMVVVVCVCGVGGWVWVGGWVGGGGRGGGVLQGTAALRAWGAGLTK